MRDVCVSIREEEHAELSDWKDRLGLVWKGVLVAGTPLDERPELIADGGVSTKAAEGEDELEAWARENFPTHRLGARVLDAVKELEHQRREAVRRADAAEVRAGRQVSARPSTGLVVDGRDLGPALTAGSYLLAAGLGFAAGAGVGE